MSRCVQVGVYVVDPHPTPLHALEVSAYWTWTTCTFDSELSHFIEFI